MNNDIKKYSKTLELDKILESLSLEATLEDAKELCTALEPESDLEKLKIMLKNTEEAYILIAKHSAPTFGTVHNVNSPLTRAGAGAVLSISDLLNICELLRIIRGVKNWYEDCSSYNPQSLNDYFSALLPNKFLEDKINFAIKSDTELNDNASPELYEIRRKIASKSSKMREVLDKTIHGSSAKYLQEAIITQRDGRFVVPVKTENRANITGIVHDTSASGSTVFIEPMGVVELNNEIRVLRHKEQEEINRILSELSALCADFSDTIISSYKSIVKLCFIFAKANYAYKIKATMPKLNEEGRIYLKNARHPLINYKSVVPITVSLGIDYDTMVITGPNTGGKTVTLKTVGLLTLMTMCGLMIPVDDGSEISTFTGVYADIGDEQSIEQSLSTFSSHMVNIISITEKADYRSLVLFDELCAGTDPVEGAALAISILNNLFYKGAKVVATTHYPELKAYAVDTDRVENACCEFDLKTLKPTYRLIVGMPGRSNAFAISGKLGLDSEIIEKAKTYLSDDDLKFERVVASLEVARANAESEHKKVLELRAKLSEDKRLIDAKNAEFTAKKEKLMEKTREQADAILENARYKSSLLLNELEELKKSLTSSNASDVAARARATFKKSIAEIEDANDPINEAKVNSKPLTKAPNNGDTVLICDIDKEATVVDVNEKSKKAQVVSGAIKMWVNFSNLKLLDIENKKGKDYSVKQRNVTNRKERTLNGEIDLRGMASDEGLFTLDKYIDEAILTGLSSITIIHGKGTGVLRKSVQEYLKHHPNIKTYRLGTFGEGEDGVTIAELK